MSKLYPKFQKERRKVNESKQRRPPLVLVEGLLGDPGLVYWRHLINCQEEKNKDMRLILSVNLGSLSSVHDRCCEMFYQIKGGRVDYGEEHSKACGHERFGKTYPGLYPEWSENNPIHLLGHSFGGLTIWGLQQMLAQKSFTGFPSTSEKWCRSVTCFSSPLRGSTTTYVLGTEEQPIGSIARCGLASIAHRLFYFYCWLNIAFLKLRFYDPYADHWNMWKHSLWDMIYNLVIGKQFDEGKDSAGTDLTVHKAELFNTNSTTFKATYYRSYAASMTRRDPITNYHCVIPSCSRGFLLNKLANNIGSYQFKDTAFNSSDWYENDGVIPTISQFHPGPCRNGYCTHRKFTKDDVLLKGFPGKTIPGEWQVTYLPSTSHFDVVRCKSQVLPKHSEIILKDYWDWIERIDTISTKKANRK